LAIVDPSLPGGMRNPEWQELAVIQGFPTDYLFYGAPTDVMKQVGRAVPIPLAQAILRGIVEQFQAMEAKGNRAGQSRREVRR
jgi:site-specific DNA-cytosine methylase